LVDVLNLDSHSHIGAKYLILLSLALLGVWSGVASADLVGCWPLDGDVLDYSGYGNDGTISGAVTDTTDRFGTPDSAMAFTGANNDKIDVGNDASLDLTGAMTITAWVYLDSTNPVHGSRNARIIAKMGFDRAWSSGIEVSEGGVSFPATFQVSTDGSDVVSAHDDATLPLDQWVHYAGVYTPGTSMEIYLDGDSAYILAAGIPVSQFSDNSRNVLIGNRPDSADCAWYGKLDDVRVYDTALSEAEIEAIMAGTPTYANTPSPADTAIDIGTNDDLSWVTGVGATSHDVYFGTDATPDAGEFQGNQVGVTFDPGVMALGTTYYWRIDEVNGEGTTTGLVWRFTVIPTIPDQATDPSPATTAVDIGLTDDLSWTAGARAATHDVYFGTDATPDAGEFQGNQAGVTYDPGTMATATTYYWRIDEVNGAGTTAGVVWSFTTVAVAPNESSIGINMGSNEVSLAAGNTAGVTEIKGNWNNASGGSGSLSNVVDDDGAATTVDVSWGGTVPGTWHVTANGTATGDAKMMNGYLDATRRGRVAYVTLSQIPYTTYDVYVYVGGSNPGAQGKVNDGTTTYSFTNGSINPGGDEFQAVDYVQTTDIGEGYPVANYALFEGLSSSSVTITIGDFVDVGGIPDPSDECMGIFGVQIVGVLPAVPGAATTPSPATTTTDVGLNDNLSWVAGEDATTHNVYFGTDATPDAGESKGNQAGVTYDPGLMTGSTTYYWRIDEVNAGGTTTGVVWSFTTEAVVPAQATNPSPATTATNIGLDDNLGWTAGTWATSHDIYFGTDATPDAGELQGSQGGVTYDPGTMATSTTYYWRIDEVNAVGTTTGTVWSFTTVPVAPAQATDPSPATTATDIGINDNLSWTAGAGATTHDVYFGTDATPDAGESKGNQAGVTYDPGAMATSTVYYWRIDEVNAGGTTTGVVWSFTTAPAAPAQATDPSPATTATDIRRRNNNWCGMELYYSTRGTGAGDQS